MVSFIYYGVTLRGGNIEDFYLNVLLVKVIYITVYMMSYFLQVDGTLH